MENECSELRGRNGRMLSQGLMENKRTQPGTTWILGIQTTQRILGPRRASECDECNVELRTMPSLFSVGNLVLKERTYKKRTQSRKNKSEAQHESLSMFKVHKSLYVDMLSSQNPRCLCEFSTIFSSSVSYKKRSNKGDSQNCAQQTSCWPFPDWGKPSWQKC